MDRARKVKPVKEQTRWKTTLTKARSMDFKFFCPFCSQHIQVESGGSGSQKASLVPTATRPLSDPESKRHANDHKKLEKEERLEAFY